MAQWFDALDIVARIFLFVAVPSTLLLLIQLILLIIGLGQDGGDLDGDVEGDLGDFDGSDPIIQAADSGLRLFTLWGLITFFTVLGWSGFAMVQGGIANALAILVALALGIIAMVLMASLMRAMLSLQQNGAMNTQNALGRKGQVYLTIPPNRGEPGKIHLLVQERYTEFSAITDEDAPIPSGCEVEVIGITGSNILVVRTIQEGGKQAWNG